MNTRKNSTTGAFAAFVLVALLLGLSLVFASCGDSSPLTEPGDESAPIPKDQTATDIVITFKNGWETELYAIGEAPDMTKDDPYTKDYITKAVYPPKIKATVNKQENNDYNTALAAYNENARAWKEYNDKMAKKEEAVKPEGDPLTKPVAPIASLPYLPGSPIVDEYDREIIVGNQPDWDYHIFTGWLVYPYYPKAEGAYDIAENPAVSGDITMVAQWEAAPARPFMEITFEKADGSKAFEKRIAVPEKLTYEANDQSGAVGNLMDHDGNPDTPDIYVIENDKTKAKGYPVDPIIVKYENFRINPTDVQGGTLAQNIPLIPVFAREHYEIDSSKPWAGSAGAAINPSAYFENNTFVYQQWKPLLYTITFNSNGIGGTIAALNTTLTGLDASKVVTGGVSAVGKILPGYGGTETSGAAEYKFDHWSDAAQGGNTYIDTTGINGNTTLYARWNIVGGVKRTFIPTGAVQTFQVTTTGTYTIEAWGAQGGGAQGGKGGYSAGTITLTQGVTLYVYVGGQGQASVQNLAGIGGYNGGANGGRNVNSASYAGGDGGGGASDVRLTGGAWDLAASLNSRIIVAGGGGGASRYRNTILGGYGGGANGGDTVCTVFTSSGSAITILGGGQTVRTSAAPQVNGTFGKGAPGGASQSTATYSEGHGGGGGGYYGGNSLGYDQSRVTGGGGGSSYVKGLASTPGNGAMNNGSNNFTGGITTANQSTGGGKVVISFIPN